MLITSPQNPHIKNLLALYKKRNRTQTGLFLIEGYREITRALQNNLIITNLYISNNQTNISEIENCQQQFGQLKISPTIVTEKIFNKISYRENPDGYLAVFRQPATALPQFDPPKHPPLFLVLESPEKPGNLGAILRTADATHLDAIIICDPHLDIFNPNVIRAACGTFFSRPIYLANFSSTLDFLNQHNCQIVGTTPHTKKLYYQTNFSQPTALVMGTEHDGLTPNWLKHCHQKIKIPMLGQADSLNLSVSTAIILYEALKQKQSKPQ